MGSHPCSRVAELSGFPCPPPLNSQFYPNKLKITRTDHFLCGRCWAQQERKLPISLESRIIPEEKQASPSSYIQRVLDTNALLRDSLKSPPSTNASLVEALQSCAEQDVACFHFPGHNRGKAAPPTLSHLTTLKPFHHDLPELPELDDLFSPKGVIQIAQKQASELFGASKTWFLVGGTTSGIQASIMATCSPGETLILPRNSHISAISGLVLSGAVPKYIMPEYNSEWDIAGGITSAQVEKALKDLEGVGRRAAAVLVTSPTYHGICSNVEEITKICHSYNVPVLVDEAHGAHFRFHDGLPSTALEQGADLVVQSTHKVLCSLTQSSMLHSSGGKLVENVRVSKCLQMLQTSSPSYLLLASLDAARAQLSENAYAIFDMGMDLAVEASDRLSMIPGVSILKLLSFISGYPSMDPFRITVGVSRLGISGYMADDILSEERKVLCELAGSRSLTFAINMGTCREDVERLVLGIKHLSTLYMENERGRRLESGMYEPFGEIAYGLSPREAFFAKKREIGTEESIGEISGELISSYPPGIPVLIPGEIITEKALSYLLDVQRMGAAISGAADHQLSSLLVCNV